MPDLDLRIFILIDQIEKMATSDGIWFVVSINLSMIRPLTRLRMMICWLLGATLKGVCPDIQICLIQLLSKKLKGREFSLVCGVAPLKTMVSTIRQLSDDCIFTFTEDGVSASVVDSSHACLLFSHIPSANITDIQLEDEVQIAINLEALEGALKLGSKSDTVKLNLAHEGGALALDIGGLKRLFSLDLSIVTNPPTPKIDLSFPLKLQAQISKRVWMR